MSTLRLAGNLAGQLGGRPPADAFAGLPGLLFSGPPDQLSGGRNV